jgi:ABC-type sugar transport system permease subunit
VSEKREAPATPRALFAKEPANAFNRALSLRGRNRRDLVAGYTFVLPSLVLILVFTFVPALYGFAVSFTRWDMLSPQWTFVGLGNYTTLLQSRELWHCCW